ncbi:MAG: hypothetical protein KGL39_33135 [Patescibacteria group bacterium]|nr:hypothetical protein [Patescibacteria group bacterium]
MSYKKFLLVALGGWVLSALLLIWGAWYLHNMPCCRKHHAQASVIQQAHGPQLCIPDPWCSAGCDGGMGGPGICCGTYNCGCGNISEAERNGNPPACLRHAPKI